MTAYSSFLPEALLAYLESISEEEHPLLAKIRQDNTNHRKGSMMIGREEVQVLTWLARLINAKHYLEIGVFTGHSSSAMALVLPEDGTVTACDINVTYTDEARKSWEALGIAHKIQLILQPAIISMDDLLNEGKALFFDMILIDADKLPIDAYLERALALLRSGGVIAIDNIFLGGRVYEVTDDENGAVSALKAFNKRLRYDPRVTNITLPLGDGLTLLLKK